MEIKKAKKIFARPVQVNSSQTPSATTAVRTTHRYYNTSNTF